MTVIIRRKNSEKAYATIRNVVAYSENDNCIIVREQDGEEVNKLMYSKPEFEAEVKK